MPYKNLDDLQKELGIPTKGKHAERTSEYTNINLNFRMATKDAKRLLLTCKELDISESQFARRTILKALESL